MQIRRWEGPLDRCKFRCRPVVLCPPTGGHQLRPAARHARLGMRVCGEGEDGGVSEGIRCLRVTRECPSVVQSEHRIAAWGCLAEYLTFHISLVTFGGEGWAYHLKSVCRSVCPCPMPSSPNAGSGDSSGVLWVCSSSVPLGYTRLQCRV
jgi:hypothetical protein